MEHTDFRFDLTVREGSVRVQPDRPAGLEQLSFRQGSALYATLMKSLRKALRKQGFVPSPDEEEVSSPDVFAILSGERPLPWRLSDVSTAREIVMPPICVFCPKTGSCHIVDCPPIVVA